MSEQQHIHLIGVCGTAMASLAGMLKQRGLKVTGSDNAVYPPMSDFLAAQNIPILQPFNEANLKPRPDLVVVGNAISRGNAELEYVLDERIPMRSLPQVVQEYFLRARDPLVVAGTHGKTTTTSMLAWIFHVAGKNPSFLIGGIAENFGSSFAVKQGQHFIIEGDEYDTAFFDKGPKFLHYMPLGLIITSVEFDHADIYADLEAVKTAFKRLVNLVPQRGRIVAWDGSPNVDECVAKAFAPVERYGFAEGSFWRAVDVHFSPEGTTWRVLRERQPWAEFESSLAGDYNVLNATAAAALAAWQGIDSSTIAEALRTFKSVKRRMEVKAEIAGITIIDDFAHHPTAITGTLEAVRTRYPQARIWAVLEPRSNTLRRKVFEKELAGALGKADQVVVCGVFKAESLPEEQRLDPDAVINGLKRAGKSAQQLENADKIVETIAPQLKAGDVVVLLSNGGFGGIYEKLPAKLKALHEVDTRA